MEDTVIPFQQAKGMTVIASFIDEEDEDGYVWIRRFDDEDDRVARYAAVYEDTEWRERIGPTVRELLLTDRTVVTRVQPTPASAMQ
jgi:hypothetical protein